MGAQIGKDENNKFGLQSTKQKWRISNRFSLVKHLNIKFLKKGWKTMYLYHLK